MSNVTINPQWLAYNNLHNEGGEGYNPHRKWIAKTAPATVPAVAKTTDARMLRDERGNSIPAAKLAARLAKDTATLPTLINESARAIVQASIDFARAQLAA